MKHVYKYVCKKKNIELQYADESYKLHIALTS